MFRFIHAPGYNRPAHLAMFISQYAHLMFLHNWITYETYGKIQDTVYSWRNWRKHL